MVYIPNEAMSDKLNWKIYHSYSLGKFKECLKLIEKTLFATKGQSEYAVYVKGLISRIQGNIEESLQLFQVSVALNPNNINNLKQVGRSLFLLGRYESAINIYEKAKEIYEEDWELWHNIGLCYFYLKKYDLAIESYEYANSISRHDSTFLSLGKLYILLNDYNNGIEIYKEALEFSPENSEILSLLGLLYLRNKNYFDAFDTLGNSLTHNNRLIKSILGAGSIIQKHDDYDVALMKYRIGAYNDPLNFYIWNNVGICFYSKKKYLESIVSLKKSLYLNPFSWVINYNLGLLNLMLKQYASSFHFFSCSINLNKNYSLSYMYLGINLFYLNDYENCIISFNKALFINNNKNINKQKLNEQNIITSNEIINNNQNNNNNTTDSQDNKNKSEEADDIENNNNNNNTIIKQQPIEIIINECLIRINYCIIYLKRIEYINNIQEDDMYYLLDENEEEEFDNWDENKKYNKKLSLINDLIEQLKELYNSFIKIWDKQINKNIKSNELQDITSMKIIVEQFIKAC